MPSGSEGVRAQLAEHRARFEALEDRLSTLDEEVYSLFQMLMQTREDIVRLHSACSPKRARRRSARRRTKR